MKTKKRKARKVRFEEINLSDPNLEPHHRNDFIALVKGEVTSLDEMIGSWYRHAGECGIEGCDCGGDALAEKAEIMCSHIHFIKERWGEVIIDQYPYFAKFIREFGGDGYERLSLRPTN